MKIVITIEDSGKGPLIKTEPPLQELVLETNVTDAYKLFALTLLQYKYIAYREGWPCCCPHCTAMRESQQNIAE